MNKNTKRAKKMGMTDWKTGNAVVKGSNLNTGALREASGKAKWRGAKKGNNN